MNPFLSLNPLQPWPKGSMSTQGSEGLKKEIPSNLDAGWLDIKPSAVELYDLRLDPEEIDNRADDPELADVRADPERRLLKWMQRTDDPLLDGTPEPPVGAIVDPTEQISPS